MQNLIFELKRRKVFPALTAYIVVGWILVQAASLLVETFDLSDWTMRSLTIALVALFPFVALFSWRYDVTSSGIVRTDFANIDTAGKPLGDRRIRLVIIGLLGGALALSFYANFRSQEGPPELATILVANIENNTDNALFSGVVEETLRVGLEVAPFVDMYPRDSAKAIAASFDSDAAASTLDRETAILVALRESIDIVLDGKISKQDEGLSIEVTGFAPGAAEPLFRVAETVAGQAEILDAIARISRNLRAELGDTETSDDAGRNESFAVANLEAAAEYLKAQQLQRGRELEEAVEYYEAALRHDPEFARAYAGLALTEQYLGRTEAAEAHWNEALSRLDTLTDRGRMRTLGVYYVSFRRDYPKALETFEQLVDAFPADNVAQNNLAVAAFYTMDFARAQEVGGMVAERFPEHSGYGANLALYSMYAGNFDNAAEEAARVLHGDDKNVYAYTVKALTAAVGGDFDSATETYEKMKELDEFGQSVAPEGLADLALNHDNFEAAKALLNATIEQDGPVAAGHSGALKNVLLAEALSGLGDREAAAAAIANALDASGGDPAVLVPAALLLADLEDTSGATKIANELGERLSATPRAYSAAINAYVAAVLGDHDAARHHADAALAAQDLWLVRLLRAEVFHRAGQADEARLEIEECRKRPGEAIAVFLNDRPSLRMLHILEDLSVDIG